MSDPYEAFARLVVYGKRTPTHRPLILDTHTGCLVHQGKVRPMRTNPRTGRQTSAARVLYEQHHGPVPDDLVVEHLCQNKMCLNIDHLDAVPQTANMARDARHRHGPRRRRLRRLPT